MSGSAGVPIQGETGRVDGEEDGIADGDLGGDPVCWLDRVCPQCGAMPAPDEGDGERCWRCDAT
jgi:hypothetical protein